jgi:hypothetical protein
MIRQNIFAPAQTQQRLWPSPNVSLAEHEDLPGAGRGRFNEVLMLRGHVLINDRGALVADWRMSKSALVEDRNV